MLKIKCMLFKEPANLLGRSLKIFLKDGGAFYFYCNEAGVDYIAGFDDESLNLKIEINDIDYVVGG
jgi:hypothetical protein